MEYNKMDEKVIEEIKALFFYFWKVNFSYGLVRGSYKTANDFHEGNITQFSSNMLIAWALVSRFYNGNHYTEEIWDEAKKYLVYEEELMR
jgi:hypothetical protein